MYFHVRFRDNIYFGNRVFSMGILGNEKEHVFFTTRFCQVAENYVEALNLSKALGLVWICYILALSIDYPKLNSIQYHVFIT